MKALLLENIHPLAVEVLEDRGFEVELLSHSLSEADLVERLAGVHLLGIRSNTTVTAKVLDEAPDLLAVGCFRMFTIRWAPSWVSAPLLMFRSTGIWTPARGKVRNATPSFALWRRPIVRGSTRARARSSR